MKVKELIEELKKLDPEKLVVMSSDGEGNSYDVLYQIDDDSMYKDNEVGLAKLTPELEEEGYSEDDVIEGEPCIILYP